jgi:beta-mannosidase
MAHPSLVIYNGGNENLWGFRDWGWPEELDGRSWGEVYATKLFQDLVSELDPTRPYSANSPCAPPSAGVDVHPNDPDHGTHHQWEVWNRVDYTEYRSEIPRFCSEFGFQGPPTWRTLTDWVHARNGGPLDEAADPKNEPAFLAHQKAEDGNAKLDRGLAPHLGVPTDFTDWHWATQLNQANAVSYAIDHYRRWWPRTSGAIVWQLNDCWPATSWAAIDSEGRLKPLAYALRHAFAPRRVSIVDDVACVLNDTPDVWASQLTLSLEQLDGVPVAEVSVDVRAEPWTSMVIPLPDPVRRASDPTREVLVARFDGYTFVQPFVPDTELALHPNPLDIQVIEVADGYVVKLRARSLAKDVALLADRLATDATVDDTLVTLPAGATASFHLQTTARRLADKVASWPALRSANDLRHPATAVPA